jgi:GNAT superfamily N-acetyltransferase
VDRLEAGVDSPINLRQRRGAEDAVAIAGLIMESNAYYTALAPDFFADVDEEGLTEWIAGDAEWLAQPTTFALVAEVDGHVGGYIEASIQEPDDTARFNGSRDSRERRLFINSVVTAERYKRRGVATRLVAAAESWARDQGATLSLCDTFLGSPQSLPFWENRMGYERRSVRLRKRLTDHLVNPS